MSMQMTAAKGNYRGDPGLFGFLGKLAGGAVGFATGGVGGAIAGFRGPRPMPPGPTAFPGGPRILYSAAPNGRPQVVPEPGLAGFAKRFVPGGASGYEVAGGAKAASGYHWNKTGYFTQSEGWIEKGTKLVKNRRRNPGNMRAASRAMARMTASKNAMKMLNRVTIRKPDTCK